MRGNRSCDFRKTGVSWVTSVYVKYVKRILDILCASLALVVFCWLYVAVALLVRAKLGAPVLFTQARPGRFDPKTGRERIFKIYKFRTMTDARDADGKLLPDEQRLTPFGRALRSTSLDELPEAFNILRGDMSVVGPRPQLVRDLVFMSEEQRMRHTVRPGLTGLAQVNGRNDTDWDTRFGWDLRYVEHVCFAADIRIILRTVKQAIVHREGITEGDMATSQDYGDYLLRTGRVSQEEYDAKQAEARERVGL